jgi:small subunit ribosomal protein S1
VTGQLREGDLVEGTVTNVAPFGVFVDVGEGVEGLAHTSEIPDPIAARAGLETGSPVTVRVLSVDQWQHRIALRLHEAGPPPAGTWAAHGSP